MKVDKRKLRERFLKGVQELHGNKGWFPLRKIRIGSDWSFFHLVLSAPPDKKKLKILQFIWVADHRFKLEQKIGTESPCEFSVVPIRSDPLLIFLSRNRP